MPTNLLKHVSAFFLVSVLRTVGLVGACQPKQCVSTKALRSAVAPWLLLARVFPALSGFETCLNTCPTFSLSARTSAR